MLNKSINSIIDGVSTHNSQNTRLLAHFNSSLLSWTKLNEDWLFFKQIASKISSQTAQLPWLVSCNKNQYTDKSIWTPSDTPNTMAAQGARSWGQYRFYLGHNRRNHPSSPFNEEKADKIEKEVKDMTRPPLSQSQSNIPLPPSIQEHEITRKEIWKLLDSLPPDKAPFVDGIPNHILLNFLTTLSFYLQSIWNLETYPEDCTKSLVQPIYKGGGKPKNDQASYRCICLTCSITKQKIPQKNSEETYILRGIAPSWEWVRG